MIYKKKKKVDLDGCDQVGLKRSKVEGIQYTREVVLLRGGLKRGEQRLCTIAETG
jgi:hypothetical protein